MEPTLKPLCFILMKNKLNFPELFFSGGNVVWGVLVGTTRLLPSQVDRYLSLVFIGVFGLSVSGER